MVIANEGDNMVDYKGLSCICNMKDDEFEEFNKLVDEYSSLFSNKINLDGSAYTLHDFDHHCFNIYNIISTVLFDEKIAYGKDILSHRELYILNVAVLFHDISMSDSLTVKRENHSRVSADFVKKEYEKSHSVLRNKTSLTSKEIYAIRAIITAHSNIKDGSVSPSNNGLDAPELADCRDKYGNKIHTKAIAAVLRLADELDVTCERIGDGRIEDQLKDLEDQYNNYIADGNEEESKKIQGYMDSYRHWTKLHYFEEICKGEQVKIIELIVNDEYVQQRLDEGDSESAVVDVLCGVADEIQRKLDECVEKCSKDDLFIHIIVAREVQIRTKIDSISAQLKKRKGYSELQSVKGIPSSSNPTGISGKAEKKKPRVIDEDLEEEIYNEIRKRGLIKFGHFLLNDSYCARDWINIREIIETKKLLKKICDAITKHIMINSNADDYMLLGIDMVGALVASRVAFALQKPFSYVSSKNDMEYDSLKEKEFESNYCGEIVLITESMVSCDTVNDIITRYSIRDKIGSIYTLLYRSSVEYDLQCKSTAMVYSLNNKFAIELFPKKNCVYGEENCNACNRRLTTNCH